MAQRQARETGFTLVEVLVTFGIIAALAALTFASLGQPQTDASLNGTVETLMADLKSQQLLAMSGDSGSQTTQQPHGIVVSGSDYTLFSGSSYNSGDSDNYTVTPGSNVSFTTTFPSSQVLFDKASGEVNGFTGGSNTITVSVGGSSRTISITQYGTVTAN